MKNLYGLKEARRISANSLKEQGTKNWFEIVPGTSTVFAKVVDGQRITLITYVDDMILCTESPQVMKHAMETGKIYIDVDQEQELKEYLRLHLTEHE